HVWQARRLQTIYPATFDLHQQAKQHLELALRSGDFDDAEAEQLLGETVFEIALDEAEKALTALDQETRQKAAQRIAPLLQQAETILAKAVKRRPEARLSLARVSVRLDRRAV